MDAGHFGGTDIEVRDPHLRSAFLGRDEREALAIRSPARAVAVLVGDEDAFSGRGGRCRASLGLGRRGVCPYTSLDGRDARRSTGRCQRGNPDVRRFLVRREVHIHRTEQHPLAIGRGYRLAHTLKRHHVFECEWALGLRKRGNNVKKCKDQGQHTAHTFLREQTR